MCVGAREVGGGGDSFNWIEKIDMSISCFQDTDPIIQVDAEFIRRISMFFRPIFSKISDVRGSDLTNYNVRKVIV